MIPRFSKFVKTFGLLIVFEFDNSLRQYFSLYQAVSQRQKEKRNDKREKKISNNPHPLLLQAS